MVITRRTLTASVLVAATMLILGACGSSKSRIPTAAPTAEAATAASIQSATPAPVPTVLGYRPGETPPIPLFPVPAIGVFVSNADKTVFQAAPSSSVSVPDVTVSPAKCGGMSLMSGSTVPGGDGPTVFSSDKGTVVDDGTGSGAITGDPISITHGGDGSDICSNTDTMVTTIVEADGSGTYSTTTTSIILNSNGDGNYSNVNSMESIINNGDNSGQSSEGTVVVINNGDGASSYSDGKLTIQNNDNGMATVNGVTVNDAPKVKKVSKLGKFPAIESLEPVEPCDTVVTLEDDVLFDLGESNIRPETTQTLKNPAGVLNSARVPTAHICGYTDSTSDEAFSLQLLQGCADAVSTKLKKNGVSAILDVTSYSESKPVASNESADGSDNLTGRTLNRRAEIFIPAF